MIIRIATRKSALALWQANHVAELLSSLPEVEKTELLPLSTRGDEILDRSLQKIGGKGLFTKELEVAIETDAADIAVHSMKDIPADLPTGFCIAATLARANYADALISRNGEPLSRLADGATVGTSSFRRQAQLLMMRPDLTIKPLRGNVNTRLQKLRDGEFDAIVLAAAGLERLGMADQISQEFGPAEMLPAAAQGVLGIECLEHKTELRNVVAQLDDAVSLQTTRAERAIARALQASCQSPVAAHASIDGDTLTLTALVAHPNGAEFIRDTMSGTAKAAESLGQALADRLIAQGARELLRRIEGDIAASDD